METDIPILNLLLGHAENLLPGQPEEGTGAPPKTQAMLIRGAPGSGKTTLALEILARQITRTKSPAYGVFLSLEVNPRDAWMSVYRRLSPELKAKFPNLEENLVSSGGEVVVLENSGIHLRLVGRKWLDHAIPYGDWHIVEKRLKDEIGALAGQSSAIGKRKGLIVLDTVNLLGDMVQHKLFSPTRPADMRAVMHGIWTVLEQTRSSNNLILIGEHHPGAPYDVSLMSESFACDIEVLLAAEPIAGTPTIPTNLLGTLGYSFERRQHSKPLSDEPQSVEIRSFCRVLKSRFTPNQSRRCAYDIVAGQGVVFTESYPGDGGLLLFHENAKQKEWWESFLSLDVPLQFPALRYSLFDRKSLQHVFSTQRRFNQLHQKTDLFLACFDTYWVNWYWQMGRRSHLRSVMEASFPTEFAEKPVANEEARKAWSRFLCGVDRFTRIAMSRERTDRWWLDTNPQSHSRNRFIEQWVSAREDPAESRKTIHDGICKAKENLAGGKEGLLQLIPKSRLRLFGERRSDIIEELEQHDENQGHLPRTSDKEHYLSVPYNANASFLVCRKDLLNKRLQSKNVQQWKTSLNELLEAQKSALASFKNAQTERTKSKRTDEEWKYDHEAIDQRVSTHSPPTLSDEEKKKAEKQVKEDDQRREETREKVLLVHTWEDLILLCMDGKYEHDNDGKKAQARAKAWDDNDQAARAQLGEGVKASSQFVIEAQTFDSLLCFFLEIFWGVGGELRINPQYEIDNVTATEQQLFHAFFLLREMFRLNVIERYSTLDPKRFAERFPSSSPPAVTDWLFARHWYSTFVDVLTHKPETLKPDPAAEELASQADATDRPKARTNYTWQPGNDVEMRIQPLPYSEVAFPPGTKGRLVSCWGEWHFAILNGSENQTLGIELINNLMGSNAICERAARCVAVPTVEEFYDRYGNVPCLRLPERDDLNEKGIPQLTYQQLRDCIFDVARSRRPIFDYRHSMREIHSVIALVQHDPHISVEKLAEHVLQAVDRIHLLQTQEVMSH